MSVEVEQNRNTGNLHIVSVTNVTDITLKGNTVRIVQENGKYFSVRCNSPFAAEFAKELLITKNYLKYEETFLPLQSFEEVPEWYVPGRVILDRLQSIGFYNIESILSKQPDLTSQLTYHELANLLKGRVPANFNYEIAEKTIFMPYKIYASGIIPSTFWRVMRLRANAPIKNAEDLYLEHEAGFCPR